MNWLLRLTGNRASSTTVTTSGREIDVQLTGRADSALAERDQPLVAEIVPAFACFVRKEVRFHEAPTGANFIPVNGKLVLHVTTMIPGSCEVTTEARGTASAVLANFMPK